MQSVSKIVAGREQYPWCESLCDARDLGAFWMSRAFVHPWAAQKPSLKLQLSFGIAAPKETTHAWLIHHRTSPFSRLEQHASSPLPKHHSLDPSGNIRSSHDVLQRACVLATVSTHASLMLCTGHNSRLDHHYGEMPQRTTSIMGSQAAAAASLRNEHSGLELERFKLERARTKSEELRMQLQLKDSDNSKLSKGQRAAGLSRKVSTLHLLQPVASMRCFHNRCDYYRQTCSGTMTVNFRLEEDMLRP